jgi:Protein affecting phage T7 exclusion by the F plasmid
VLTRFLAWQLIVALVVLTALVGLLFVRLAGRHTIVRIQRRLRQGEVPTNELIDGGLLLVAAGFLLTPGLVTDGLGFLIVVPVTRYPFRWGLKRWVLTPYFDEKSGGFVTGRVYTGGFPDGNSGTGTSEAGTGDRPGGDPDPGTGTDAGHGPNRGVQDVDYDEVKDSE